MEKAKRYAAHRLHLDNEEIRLGYVEVSNNVVIQYGNLEGEKTQTYWLGGTIDLVRTTKGLLAFYKNKLL